MECVIGITGKDFVLVASDTNQAHSIVVMKHGIIIIIKYLFIHKSLFKV
jgi:20S proteasome alpha/beta subunit